MGLKLPASWWPQSQYDIVWFSFFLCFALVTRSESGDHGCVEDSIGEEAAVEEELEGGGVGVEPRAGSLVAIWFDLFHFYSGGFLDFFWDMFVSVGIWG